jgi:hypothetical protein
MYHDFTRVSELQDDMSISQKPSNRDGEGVDHVSHQTPSSNSTKIIKSTENTFQEKNS